MGHRGRRGALLATAMTVGVALGACGDDDGDDAANPPASGADADAYCNAALAWDTAPDPDDFGDEESVAEHFESVLLPRFEALEAAAPAEIEGAVGAIRAALDGEGDEGEAEAANLRIHEYSAGACEWNTVEVAAVEFAFEGAPASLPAGVVSFEVVNQGDEAHSLVVLRRNEGVSTPFADLVALPDDELFEQAEPIEPGAFVDPGGEDFAVADLAPGDYALVCTLPIGTATLDEADHEFTVD
ncbi:MAG: hypothetical protein ACRDZN_03490 [Acidimicrobiales bacterium]